MANLIYNQQEQVITYYADDGAEYPYECRSAFVEGYNESGQPRATLPVGEYTAVAEEPPTDYGPAYGSFYINTGDYRARDIHGGGSGLNDPYEDYQGWIPTYGCLRMQNADGQQLSRLMIADGNNIPFSVVEE